MTTHNERAYAALHEDYTNGLLSRQEYEQAFKALHAQENTHIAHQAHAASWLLIGLIALIALAAISALIILAPWLMGLARGTVLGAALLVGLIAVLRQPTGWRRLGLALASLVALGLALIYAAHVH